MAALCLVTVSALILIFAFSEEPAKSVTLIHSAPAFTPIYEVTAPSQQLTELRAAQSVLGADPDNADAALNLSRVALGLYQLVGNARFLGLAKASLTPWWHSGAAPLPIWLTRARIKQTEHQFEQAATDLSALNSQHRGNIEALLLETDAWRRAGKIYAAKKACIAVALAGRTDLASVCSAEILLALGDANRANTLLSEALAGMTQQPPAVRDWAWSIYADSFTALDQNDKAAEIWSVLTQSAQSPLSYRLAYADLLLTMSQWQQVSDLLSDRADNTAALLRLVIAARRSGGMNLTTMQDELEQRLKIAATSGAAELYLRDQALFAWKIEDNPTLALDFARRNWDLQKSWEDTELVLRIAIAAKDSAAQALIRAWRATASTEQIQ
jgi:hypothetical protein